MSETKIVAGKEYVVSPEGKIGKRVIRLKNNDYREWQGIRTEDLRREHKLVLWLVLIFGISIITGLLTIHNLLFQFFIAVGAIAIYMCLTVRWIRRCSITSNAKKCSILSLYETFKNVSPQEVGVIDQSKDPSITFVVLPVSEVD